jgi:hypothetical protein
MAGFWGELDAGHEKVRATSYDQLDATIQGQRCGIRVTAVGDYVGRDSFEILLTGGAGRVCDTVPLLLVALNTDGSVDITVEHPALGHAPGAFPVTVRQAK